MTSTLESVAAEFSESNFTNNWLTLQPPTTSSTFPSPPPSIPSTCSATSFLRSGPQSLVPNDAFANIYLQIEDYNCATLLNCNSERFYPCNLILTIKVDSNTPFKFIWNYQKVPDRHWLSKIEYYYHQLRIASTRMGEALASHNVALTALCEHLQKFWYIEHRIPFMLYKKANVDVQPVCLFFLGQWRLRTNELARYQVIIPTQMYGTWYTAYTPDAGISCGVGIWAPFIVEVTNTQKYGDLLTKRSYWQHESLGGVKMIILMTYQPEHVLDNYTCILEIWKTAHRAHPDGKWQFLEPPPSTTF